MDVRALAYYVSSGDPRLCALKRIRRSQHRARQSNNARNPDHRFFGIRTDSWVGLDRDGESGISSELLQRNIVLQTRLGNQVNLALWVWASAALVVLLSRKRTMLDLWLIVTLLACMPNFLVAIIGSSVRFTIGWYAARFFVLVGSCMLLTVLLVETTFLYTRLASALVLQRRERNNRLLSVNAVTAVVAHELRTPLGAIALNASTALSQLRSNPP